MSEIIKETEMSRKNDEIVKKVAEKKSKKLTERGWKREYKVEMM